MIKQLMKRFLDHFHLLEDPRPRENRTMCICGHQGVLHEQNRWGALIGKCHTVIDDPVPELRNHWFSGLSCTWCGCRRFTPVE